MGIENISNEDQQVIVDVARDVVAQIAPQEIPVFRPLSQAYLRDPDAVLRGDRKGDQVLGFGVGEAVQVLTPVVLAVATEVVKFILSEAAKSAKTEGAATARLWVTSAFSRLRPAVSASPTAATSPALSADRLRQIHDVAYKAALNLSLAPDKATQLANAMVGELVLAD